MHFKHFHFQNTHFQHFQLMKKLKSISCFHMKIKAKTLPNSPYVLIGNANFGYLAFTFFIDNLHQLLPYYKNEANPMWVFRYKDKRKTPHQKEISQMRYRNFMASITIHHERDFLQNHLRMILFTPQFTPNTFDDFIKKFGVRPTKWNYQIVLSCSFMYL